MYLRLVFYDFHFYVKLIMTNYRKLLTLANKKTKGNAVSSDRVNNKFLHETCRYFQNDLFHHTMLG